MIDNDDLKQALGTLERFAPAENEVLTGMRHGIARRRKRRQVASVVGVAGAAAVVALGVVYATQGRTNDGTGFAGAAAPPPTASTQPAQPVPSPVLPFSVGWIPDGYRLGSWEAGSTDGSTQYVGAKDFQTIVVWISAQPRETRASDSNEPTTIAGRSGVIRRLAEDTKETQLIWQLADGRWAMVGGRAPTVSLATLRQVAESVSATPTPMPAPFSLAAMPDGYRNVSWLGGGDVVPGSLTLCRSDVEPRSGSQPADCVSVSILNGSAPAVTYAKDATKPKGQVEVPIDQPGTVDGVMSRATADGTLVVAQLDANHWVQAHSLKAGADLLRQVIGAVRP